MNKTKVNYWVDVVIALAFIMSAVSGIVFLLPTNASTVFGIAYNIWDQIHTWGSLLMIAGVLVHFILHWKWLVAMTGKILSPPAKKPVHSVAGAGGTLMSRRQFLRTAGLGAAGLGAAALGMGMVAVSLKSLLGDESAEENQTVTDGVVLQPEATSDPSTIIPTQSPSTSSGSESAVENQIVTDETVVQPEATSIPPTVVPTQSIAVAPSSQTTSVACHKGITYDSYPGRCRHYVDNDGDGYCDLSIPT